METEESKIERDLAGIPIMDEDDVVLLAPSVPPPQESAPISARGRVALAKELLRRAAGELQLVQGPGVSKALEANALAAALRARAVYMDLDEAEDGE